MSISKPRVLLGPMFTDPAESVSSVNRIIVAGLSQRYEFIFSRINRTHGGTRQAMITCWNCFYAFLEATHWLWNLLHRRPHIAHYAVSSGWAMEKSLLLLMLARWSGAKAIGHLHSGGFVHHWQHLPGWRRALAQRQMLKLDGFIVLSGWWRGQMANNVGIPKENLWVVNNPIEPAFEKQALSFPIEREKTTILSLGTLGRDKGVFELVEACGILHRMGRHFHLMLVGPEREPGIKAEVERRIADESCSGVVSLRGAIFGADKTSLFRDSSIFVLPSYYENFPLVVLESAAAGLAIVTTPVGAIPEFFKQDASAVFVPVKDAAALAAALEHLLLHPAETHKLGQAARTVFQKHLQRDMIFSSLDNAYTTILAQSATPNIAGSKSPTPTNPTIQ